MTFGRKAPDGIPQRIWDAAIDEWLEDSSTIDSSKIMKIAKRMQTDEILAPEVLKRWWPDATETVSDD